jgi:hypothetical protein
MKARILIANPHQGNSTYMIPNRGTPIGRFPAVPGLLVCLLLLGMAPAWVQSSPVTYSIWSDATVPQFSSWSDPNSAELGLRFGSTVDGYITGIRFYKGPENTGTHVGNVWTSSGALLGSVTFENETASGWQLQALASPVPISANTTYVVSYHETSLYYAVDPGYFVGNGVDSGPLRALAAGEAGFNGIYAYNAVSAYPDQNGYGNNYWVDVVMVPDEIPPIITCPPDLILLGAAGTWNTNVINTGLATATDDFGISKLTPSDSVKGVCPMVVSRTWTAIDPSGNKASCVQTITCLPPSMVTDSGGCIFDVNPTSPDQDFGLTFSQGKKWTGYMLTGTVPGHFGYNVFYVGTPNTLAAFDVKLPSPFVTSGLNPIQAYDWVTVTGNPGQQCLKPSNEIFFSPQTIGLADFSPTTGSATVSVNVTVPSSGVVYLAIKLDYGLEDYASGYKTDPYADAISTISGIPDIPNNGIYNFNALVNGSQIDLLGTNIKNNNRFK